MRQLLRHRRRGRGIRPRWRVWLWRRRLRQPLEGSAISIVVPSGVPSRGAGFFMTEFMKAAKIGDVESGKGIVVVVKGVRVALFNCDGVYYAIRNTCPHMGGELGEGLLEGDIVTCPWHGWRFNVKTGKNP